MTREQRRRLLLRAHAAAKRFNKRSEKDPYYRPASEAFVAGYLLGYRLARIDNRTGPRQQAPQDYKPQKDAPPDCGMDGTQEFRYNTGDD